MFDQNELRVGYQAVGVIGGPYKIKAVYENNSNILIKFNLSEIPPGAEIKMARLWFYVMNPPDDQVTLYLHVLKEEYNETHVNWIQRNYTRMWRTRGGYADPNYLQKVRVDDSINEGDTVGFLITDYVRKVHLGEIEDYGLILRSEVTPLSYRDIRRGQVISYYVDFYSLEGSKRHMKSKYRPDLYVEFVKPTVILSASEGSLNLKRSESATISVSEEGTFSGMVGLAYRVIEAPGPKVGPLEVKLSNYRKQQGFPVDVTLKAEDYAPAGKYVVEFYPDTGDYGSDVVEYGKAYLTVIIEGEVPTVPQETPSTSPTTSSQAEPSTSSTSTPLSTTGPETTIPSETTKSETGRTQATITSHTTTEYVTKEEGPVSPLTLSLGVLVAVLGVLAIYLIVRRRQ